MTSSITIDDLFQVRKELEVAGKKLSVRALSDFERQQASRRGLEASARIDRALKTEGSPENLASLSTLESADDDVLKNSILVFYRREVIEKVVDEIYPTYIPFPENPSKDEEREVIEKREAELKSVIERREKALSDSVEAYSKKLESYSREQLVSECKRRTIRAIADIEQVKRTPETIRRALLDTVAEVNAIDPLSLSGPSTTE